MLINLNEVPIVVLTTAAGVNETTKLPELVDGMSAIQKVEGTEESHEETGVEPRTAMTWEGDVTSWSRPLPASSVVASKLPSVAEGIVATLS